MEMAREQGFQRQLVAGARRRLIHTVLVTHAAAVPLRETFDALGGTGSCLHHSGRCAGDGSGRLAAMGILDPSPSVWRSSAAIESRVEASGL